MHQLWRSWVAPKRRTRIPHFYRFHSRQWEETDTAAPPPKIRPTRVEVDGKTRVEHSLSYYVSIAPTKTPEITKINEEHSPKHYDSYLKRYNTCFVNEGE